MKSKFITYWTYNIYIATSKVFPVQLGTTLDGVTINNSMTVSQIPACPPPPQPTFKPTVVRGIENSPRISVNFMRLTWDKKDVWCHRRCRTALKWWDPLVGSLF